jgi:hypothetical protein
LSKARDGEACDIYMTNRQLCDGGHDLTSWLDDFLAKEAIQQPLHRYHFRNDADLSVVAA